MMSRRIQILPASVGAMAVGLTSRAGAAPAGDRTLHLAAAPADFTALGLGRRIDYFELK